MAGSNGDDVLVRGGARLECKIALVHYALGLAVRDGCVVVRADPPAHRNSGKKMTSMGACGPQASSRLQSENERVGGGGADI